MPRSTPSIRREREKENTNDRQKRRKKRKEKGTRSIDVWAYLVPRMSPSRPPSISAAFLETFPGCSGSRGALRRCPRAPVKEPEHKGLTRVSSRLQVRFTPVGVGGTDGSRDSERCREKRKKRREEKELGKGRTTCGDRFPTGGLPHLRWFAFGAWKAIRWRGNSDNKRERNSLFNFERILYTPNTNIWRTADMNERDIKDTEERLTHSLRLDVETCFVCMWMKRLI